VGLFVALVWMGRRVFGPQDVYRFPGVAGPEGITTVAEPNTHALLRYSAGSPSRLAILLTEPDASWLGLAHGLKAMGVPFLITHDYQRAVQHKVVFVYPSISGKVLSAEALQALARVPQHGGTLIGQHVLGGGLEEIFGFATAVPSTTNTELHFTIDHPATRPWTEAEERVRSEVGRCLSRALGTTGVIGGQALDLAVDSPRADLDRLERIHSRKTGSLFTASVDVGAILGGAPLAEREALSAFAKNLGLAYQILDDWLDATSSYRELGKPSGKDHRGSFVTLVGAEGAKRLADELVGCALDHLRPLGTRGSLVAGMAAEISGRSR